MVLGVHGHQVRLDIGAPKDVEVCATTALAKEIADKCGCACSANRYTTPAIMRPFIARAAAKVVSLEERVFICVSGCNYHRSSLT
jgi:hypothetical protein